MRTLSISIFSLIICTFSCAQSTADVIKKLGYSNQDKLLIIHADDLGVSHSVNIASIEAFEKKGITSASIMVPCPWFPHIAQYASAHPELCWGIHLTLTAEWDHYKWDGVSSSNEIGSILDDKNFMYASVAEVLAEYSLEEIKKELRAQIDRAIQFEVPLSHLDSHMGTLFSNEELFKAYLSMGNEYKLPILMPYNRIPKEWNVDALMGPYQVGVKQIIMLPASSDTWRDVYKSALEQIEPGINEMIIHLGKDNGELQEVMVDHIDFGATWRQNDLDYILSEEFRNVLRDNDIHMISWKEIKSALSQ